MASSATRYTGNDQCWAPPVEMRVTKGMKRLKLPDLPDVPQKTLDLVAWARSDDEDRANLLGVYFDTDCIVATNGHLITKADFATPKSLVNKIAGSGADHLKFPDYEQAIPHESYQSLRVQAPADKLLAAVTEARAAEKAYRKDIVGRAKAEWSCPVSVDGFLTQQPIAAPS